MTSWCRTWLLLSFVIFLHLLWHGLYHSYLGKPLMISLRFVIDSWLEGVEALKPCSLFIYSFRWVVSMFQTKDFLNYFAFLSLLVYLLVTSYHLCSTCSKQTKQNNHSDRVSFDNKEITNIILHFDSFTKRVGWVQHRLEILEVKIFLRYPYPSLFCWSFVIIIAIHIYMVLQNICSFGTYR